jgi:MFS family permease
MTFGDWINIDGKLVLVEKCVRTIPYGFLAVLYGVYLAQLGFGGFLIGVTVSLMVLSSASYTFVMSFFADRVGRKKTLIFFALMDFVAGSLLYLSSAWWAPVLAGIVGNMSVGVGEVGPFLSVEQAILPQTCHSKNRTLAFSIYNLIGYAASSLGALMAGIPEFLGGGIGAYRPLFAGYLVSGIAGSLLYATLSKKIEVQTKSEERRQVLSQKAKPVVEKLSALFAIDAFGGGFITQVIIAYYFSIRFGLDLTTLGAIFSVTQIITALSFLASPRLAKRIGLLRTMVFSHIPSNIFLTAISFAPSAPLAVGLLFCRHSLSQMDVPARQSYVMAVVDESDRTAAAGFTNVTRTVSQSISPSIAGYALANIWVGTPFFAAGTLKIAYDILIYHSFRKVRPPEEIKEPK